jgi:hypothetical protein
MDRRHDINVVTALLYYSDTTHYSVDHTGPRRLASFLAYWIWKRICDGEIPSSHRWPTCAVVLQSTIFSLNTEGIHVSSNLLLPSAMRRERVVCMEKVRRSHLSGWKRLKKNYEASSPSIETIPDSLNQFSCLICGVRCRSGPPDRQHGVQVLYILPMVHSVTWQRS